VEDSSLRAAPSLLSRRVNVRLSLVCGGTTFSLSAAPFWRAPALLEGRAPEDIPGHATPTRSCFLAVPFCSQGTAAGRCRAAPRLGSPSMTTTIRMPTLPQELPLRAPRPDRCSRRLLDYRLPEESHAEGPDRETALASRRTLPCAREVCRSGVAAQNQGGLRFRRLGWGNKRQLASDDEGSGSPGARPSTSTARREQPPAAGPGVRVPARLRVEGSLERELSLARSASIKFGQSGQTDVGGAGDESSAWRRLYPGAQGLQEGVGPAADSAHHPCCGRGGAGSGDWWTSRGCSLLQAHPGWG